MALFSTPETTLDALSRSLASGKLLEAFKSAQTLQCERLDRDRRKVAFKLLCDLQNRCRKSTAGSPENAASDRILAICRQCFKLFDRTADEAWATPIHSGLIIAATRDFTDQSGTLTPRNNSEQGVKAAVLELKRRGSADVRFTSTNGDLHYFLQCCEWSLEVDVLIDAATHELARQVLADKPQWAFAYPRLVKFLRNIEQEYKARMYAIIQGGGTFIAVKGSPEYVLQSCEWLLEENIPFDDDTQQNVRQALLNKPELSSRFPSVASHIRHNSRTQETVQPTRHSQSGFGDTVPAPFAEARTQSSSATVELEQLIGLSQVKEEVKRVRARVTFDQRQGITSSYRHFVFTGNPGTGKTTVARLLGRILKEVGFLKGQNFVEASRSTLIGGFIGQTSQVTAEQIEKALDGVLFIDEAHMLVASDSANDYGPEALSQINKAMEDHRDRLVVIFAGYSGPIAKLFQKEPGLESRITRTIDFPDYSVDELVMILKRELASRGVSLGESVIVNFEDRLRTELKAVVERKGNFGNARGVRNIVERMIDEHAYNVDAKGLSGDAMKLIPMTTAMQVLKTF